MISPRLDKIELSQTIRVRERCNMYKGNHFEYECQSPSRFYGNFSILSNGSFSLSLGMVLVPSALRPLYHPAVQLANGWSELATTVSATLKSPPPPKTASFASPSSVSLRNSFGQIAYDGVLGMIIVLAGPPEAVCRHCKLPTSFYDYCSK